MDLHNETPLLTAKVSNGGSGLLKAGNLQYPIRLLPSSELAAALLVRRFGLSRALATVVAELAGLGGRHQ